MSDRRSVTVTINGQEHTREIPTRLLLSDFIRHEIGLTGTHVGCEHGVCGACTIQLDGAPVRSCLIFAVQADGHAIKTVEALAPSATELHPLQEAFHEHHGLQCGFCTAGILMTMDVYLSEHPDANEDEIRHALGGNICRCTGYQNIVTACLSAAPKLKEVSK